MTGDYNVPGHNWKNNHNVLCVVGDHNSFSVRESAELLCSNMKTLNTKRYNQLQSIKGTLYTYFSLTIRVYL